MEDEIKPDLVYIYDLDYENKTCVDCRGALPKYVSINNGVIICESCAKQHTQFGYNISYTREISDEWDNYLLSFIQRGGNGRFIRLLREFKLEEMPIEQRYKTKAVEYHRKLILSEVLADSPPDQILMNIAHEECSEEIIFPEFEDYKIYKGEKMRNEQGSGIKETLVNSMKTVGEGLGNASTYIGETVTNGELKDKVINGSTMAYGAIKTASEVVYDYSKPVVSYIASKAYQGVGYVFNQIASGVNEYQNMKFQKDNLAKTQMMKEEYQYNTPYQYGITPQMTNGQNLYNNHQQQYYMNQPVMPMPINQCVCQCQSQQPINQCQCQCQSQQKSQDHTIMKSTIDDITTQPDNIIKPSLSPSIVQPQIVQTNSFKINEQPQLPKKSKYNHSKHKPISNVSNPTYEVLVKKDQVNDINEQPPHNINQTPTPDNILNSNNININHDSSL